MCTLPSLWLLQVDRHIYVWLDANLNLKNDNINYRTFGILHFHQKFYEFLCVEISVTDCQDYLFNTYWKFAQPQILCQNKFKLLPNAKLSFWKVASGYTGLNSDEAYLKSIQNILNCRLEALNIAACSR